MSAELTQVIKLAQKGDRHAFHLLYQQHVSRVYAVCWRLLGDAQKAEDACQEIFIKVWQRLSEFKGDSALGTWLHSIAARTAIDLWRQDKRLHFADSEEVDNTADALQLESHQQVAAEARDLELAIQRLPAQAKAVFILFAIEGYQHTEIATMLDIAEGSSKAQYHRARQLLRGFLDDNG